MLLIEEATERPSLAKRIPTAGQASRRGEPPWGVVASISPGSIAETAGLQPGDHLLAINGFVPRDVIDVRLDASTNAVELDIERQGRRLVLRAEKDPDADLGIEFTSPTFD